MTNAGSSGRLLTSQTNFKETGRGIVEGFTHERTDDRCRNCTGDEYPDEGTLMSRRTCERRP